MTYSNPADVRRLTGVTDPPLTDEDLMECITDADAQIDEKITVPVPTTRLIQRLSALLAAIDVYTRPDLRMGFKTGDLTVSTQDIEKSIARWERDADDILGHYGVRVPYVKATSYEIIEED